MDNEATTVMAARRADLRVMLDQGWDHYEGIDMEDALRELLDLLDAQESIRVTDQRIFVCDDDPNRRFDTAEEAAEAKESVTECILVEVDLTVHTFVPAIIEDIARPAVLNIIDNLNEAIGDGRVTVEIFNLSVRGDSD